MNPSIQQLHDDVRQLEKIVNQLILQVYELSKTLPDDSKPIVHSNGDDRAKYFSS